MAGKIVYADLNIPGASSSLRPPKRSLHLSSPPCPRWHRIAVGTGWAGNIVLTVAVIALGVWVSQLRVSGERQCRGAPNTSDKNETGIVNCTEGSFSLEDFRSQLKSILCDPQHGNLAGGAGCKLCPEDWVLRGDKCYWLSKETKNWSWSRDNCWGKRSRLLMLQSQEELDSLQNVIQDTNPVWIGLKATPLRGNWIWVDGSRLDPSRFTIAGPMDENSCCRIKGSRIHSDTCGAEFQWLCQKEAAVI